MTEEILRLERSGPLQFFYEMMLSYSFLIRSTPDDVSSGLVIAALILY